MEVMTKERPIIFSAPMVRAILEGRKTQTRRVARSRFRDMNEPDQWCKPDAEECPYGQPGDRLWVREKFAYCVGATDINDEWYSVSIPRNKYKRDSLYLNTYHIAYGCDDEEPISGPWRPSIHMPRWASRITLEITGVRVERLNEISEEDAIAEGIERVGGEFSPCPWRNYRIGQPGEMSMHCSAPSRSFMTLWQSIYGPGSWGANPWVWVVEFKKITP